MGALSGMFSVRERAKWQLLKLLFKRGRMGTLAGGGLLLSPRWFLFGPLRRFVVSPRFVRWLLRS